MKIPGGFLELQKIVRGGGVQTLHKGLKKPIFIKISWVA